MFNFRYQNPVKLIFGKNTIPELGNEVPSNRNILMTYGGGSIKKNGVYDQVKKALTGYQLFEFGGIEPNPQYRTCMKAVEVVHQHHIDFIVSVGGGSVLDASKFIAAAAKFNGEPWDILSKEALVEQTLPVGAVLTLPATGSEMNANAVISRAETGEKLAFASPLNYPVFSICDPATTTTLPKRQTANGVVDAFVHVMEQYLTYPVNSPLQDRWAESILLTLIEEGPKVLQNPNDYDSRANIMFSATMALNGLIGLGVPQDWATHQIGHELTALHGIDHARTLSIVLPAVMKHQRDAKKQKLIQYGKRVWHIDDSDENQAVDMAIKKTESFFKSMGVPVCLKDVNLTPDDCRKAAIQLGKRNAELGEHSSIRAKEVDEIINLAA